MKADPHDARRSPPSGRRGRRPDVERQRSGIDSSAPTSRPDAEAGGDVEGVVRADVDPRRRRPRGRRPAAPTPGRSDSPAATTVPDGGDQDHVTGGEARPRRRHVAAQSGAGLARARSLPHVEVARQPPPEHPLGDELQQHRHAHRDGQPHVGRDPAPEPVRRPGRPRGCRAAWGATAASTGRREDRSAPGRRRAPGDRSPAALRPSRTPRAERRRPPRGRPSTCWPGDNPPGGLRPSGCHRTSGFTLLRRVKRVRRPVRRRPRPGRRPR